MLYTFVKKKHIELLNQNSRKSLKPYVHKHCERPKFERQGYACQQN